MFCGWMMFVDVWYSFYGGFCSFVRIECVKGRFKEWRLIEVDI